MTEETFEEETLENPGEEATPEEQASTEEQETSEKPAEPSSELEEKNRRLYARAKKAEEEARKLKEELERLKKSVPAGETSEPATPVDPIHLAKTVSALKDYAPEELDFIAMISKAKNLPPEEAAQTEEARLYIAARREKVAKEKNIPEPSSPAAKFGRPKGWQDVAKMSKEEHRKLFEEDLKRKRAS